MTWTDTVVTHGHRGRHKLLCALNARLWDESQLSAPAKCRGSWAPQHRKERENLPCCRDTPCWRGGLASPVAELESDHLLKSPVLFLPPITIWTHSADWPWPHPALGWVHFIFSTSISTGHLWFPALVCALSGGSTGNVQGGIGQESAKASVFLCSLEDLQQVPELFGASKFPSVG